MVSFGAADTALRIVRALQTGPGYQGPMDGDDPDDDGYGHDGALREPRSAPAVSTGRGDVSDSVPSSTDWERRRRRWWVGGGW